MGVKVFVVDDSAVVRQALAHMLSGNAEVELIGSAPNPLLAMDMIRKNPPDVLLLDIEMPGMDGLELASGEKIWNCGIEEQDERKIDLLFEDSHSLAQFSPLEPIP